MVINMKNLFNKIVKSIIIGSILLIFVSGVFANDEGLTYKYTANNDVIFKGGDMDNKLSVYTPSLDILYKNGKLNITLTMDNNFYKGNIDLSAVLYPSQVEMFKDKALIGIGENITTNFELLCLRIDSPATSWTLPQSKLYMEGHKVIMIGILNQSTDDIYYLQQIVDDLDFNQMSGDAKNNYIKNNISDEELIRIESNYSILKSKKMLENIPTQTVGGEMTVKKNSSQSQLNQSTSTASDGNLVYRIPDSIFKSGDFDTWHLHDDYSTAARLYYTWITYHYYGTDNRSTYIIVFDVVLNFDSMERFSTQMTVRDNVSVVYNINNKTLGLSGDNNRVKANNMILQHTSNSTYGVLNGRYYTGKKTGSKIGNIIRAILAWVPYASSAISSYDYLTSSSDTSTNTWFTYPTTAQEQKIAYDGQTIKQITAQDSGFKLKNDYFLLVTTGDNINSLTMYFHYDPEYQ
jgi:hypothetical protein